MNGKENVRHHVVVDKTSHSLLALALLGQRLLGDRHGNLSVDGHSLPSLTAKHPSDGSSEPAQSSQTIHVLHFRVKSSHQQVQTSEC